MLCPSTAEMFLLTTFASCFLSSNHIFTISACFCFTPSKFLIKASSKSLCALGNAIKRNNNNGVNEHNSRININLFLIDLNKNISEQAKNLPDNPYFVYFPTFLLFTLLFKINAQSGFRFLTHGHLIRNSL